MWAERTAEGGVVAVPQALHGSPNAPQMHAQRVAQFEHYCIHNCLSPKELHQDIQEVYVPQYASACTFIYTRHGRFRGLVPAGALNTMSIDPSRVREGVAQRGAPARRTA
jgi:hypothetical protein